MTIEQTAIQLDSAPFPTNDKWLEQYIFGSFMFSQGSPDLQGHIDDYAVKDFRDHFYDLWTPGESATDNAKVARDTVHQIQSFFEQNRHVAYDRLVVENNVADRFDALKQSMFPEYTLVSSSTDIIVMIIDEMKDRENRFLLDRNRLRGGSAPSYTIRSKKTHPRFAASMLIDHVIDGKDARHPVFNQMFSDMRQTVVVEPEYHAQGLQRLEDKSAELKQIPARNILELLQKFATSK